MENIWEKALSTIKSEVNEQVFSAWFLPLQLIAIDDDQIRLGVPNKFFENWIREKYISLLKTAVQHASGKPLAISFEIVEAPDLENTATDEKAPPEEHTTHYIFFHAGIIQFEYIINQHLLTKNRVNFMALPIPFEGQDGSPVRAIAWEETLGSE